jgi:hypothetical protein
LRAEIVIMAAAAMPRLLNQAFPIRDGGSAAQSGPANVVGNY